MARPYGFGIQPTTSLRIYPRGERFVLVREFHNRKRGSGEILATFDTKREAEKAKLLHAFPNLGR
jgi:hypothetical protein